MAKEFAIQFYNSKAWKQTRKAYIASRFGLCERCKKTGYILHHKIHLTEENINDLDIALDWKNLMYVCKSCHEILHSNSNVTRNDLMFNDKGELVQI